MVSMLLVDRSGKVLVGSFGELAFFIKEIKDPDRLCLKQVNTVLIVHVVHLKYIQSFSLVKVLFLHEVHAGERSGEE